MEKKTFWIIAGIIIAVLLAVVIWQTMRIGDLSTASTAVKGATTATKAAVSSGGMVGGC